MNQGSICNLLLREHGGALQVIDADGPARANLGVSSTGPVSITLHEYAPELAVRILSLMSRGVPAFGAIEDVVLLHVDGKLQRVELRLTSLGAQYLVAMRVHLGMRQFMELSLDMLAVANTSGYFEEVSQYFATSLGYLPEELCAEPFMSFVHPADRDSSAAKFKSILDGGEAIGFVNRYRRKDGQYRWLSWHCNPPDATGRMYAVARDITQDNQRSYTRIILERALSDLRLGVVLTDRDARVEWCNRSLCTMTGFAESELVGRRLGPTLQGPETDRAEVARLRDCIARGEGFSTLLRNYHKSGRPYWVEIQAQPLEYDGELHFLAIQQEVTERVEARRTLTRSEQRFRQAIEGSRDAIYFLDAVRDQSGTIVDFQFAEINGSAERELKLRRDQILGQSLCTRFPINREARFFDRYRQVALTGQPYSQEYEIPDGHTAPGLYRQFVAKLHDGIVIFNQDLSATRAHEREREHLHEALRQAQKMEALGQLASAVAHDFNNSLAVMRGTADALSGPLSQDAELSALLDEMCRAIDRARSFVRRLLDFARPAVVPHEPIDLSHLLGELCRTTQRTFPAGVTVRCNIEPRIVVKAGVGQIEQIVANILTNARDAVRGQGQITVQLRETTQDGERGALLEVKDDGVGMSPDVLARFTDPFFTTKGDHGGLGLGMATVLGLVKSLGGHFDAESKPEAGTTIRVTLPLSRDKGSVVVAAAPQLSLASRTARLLLVDDDPQVGRLLSRMLQKSGFQVSLATSASNAIAWAAEQSAPPDVAIVDYMMPGTNGVELARQLHSRWPRLPMLLATGGGVSDPHIQETGIQGILFKPFGAHELIDRIESLLRAS